MFLTFRLHVYVCACGHVCVCLILYKYGKVGSPDHSRILLKLISRQGDMSVKRTSKLFLENKT